MTLRDLVVAPGLILSRRTLRAIQGGALQMT
jgi:hypothetical protein